MKDCQYKQSYECFPQKHRELFEWLAATARLAARRKIAYLVTHIHGIILSRNAGYWTDRTVNRRVKTVVILRRQSEDCNSATMESVSLSHVGVAEQPGDGEFAAFDPKTCGFTDWLEHHESAIRATN